MVEPVTVLIQTDQAELYDNETAVFEKIDVSKLFEQLRKWNGQRRKTTDPRSGAKWWRADRFEMDFTMRQSRRVI